jgi:hypothetical protein
MQVDRSRSGAAAASAAAVGPDAGRAAQHGSTCASEALRPPLMTDVVDVSAPPEAQWRHAAAATGGIGVAGRTQHTLLYPLREAVEAELGTPNTGAPSDGTPTTPASADGALQVGRSVLEAAEDARLRRVRAQHSQAARPRIQQLGDAPSVFASRAEAQPHTDVSFLRIRLPPDGVAAPASSDDTGTATWPLVRQRASPAAAGTGVASAHSAPELAPRAATHSGHSTTTAPQHEASDATSSCSMHPSTDGGMEPPHIARVVHAGQAAVVDADAGQQARSPPPHHQSIMLPPRLAVGTPFRHAALGAAHAAVTTPMPALHGGSPADPATSGSRTRSSDVAAVRAGAGTARRMHVLIVDGT